MADKKSKLIKVGALWKKKDKDGVGFLSGQLDLDKLHETIEGRVDFAEDGHKMQMFVFTNKFRDKEKDEEKRNRLPQYFLNIAEPEGAAKQEEGEDDEIPF